ncbi:MAG: class I SAM-dependent RNA methyltransferase [Verrucomicrobiota bacterium]
MPLAPAKPPRKFNPDPFPYHEEIELEIDSLGNLGQGIGRFGEDRWVVFVRYALPGERIRARVYRNTSSYSEADLVEVITPSADRVEPRCKHFGDCGGCQYQNYRYEAQLDWKKQQVSELLEHMAGVSHTVEAVIPSPLKYGYRSKITPHFQKPRDGKIGPIGFLRQGRRQQLLDVESCAIASSPLNRELSQLRLTVHRNARNYRKGATLLLRESVDSEVCTDPTEMCEQDVGPIRFSFHAGEFFQNNPGILQSFVLHVAKEASANGAVRHLVDAYCGAGLFSLSSSGQFESCLGIEISESSIDWARRNQEQNEIENCRFIQGDAANIFAEVSTHPDETAVIIDPPRKGSSEAFLHQLIDFNPIRVVYVSCNPSTQMRDLNELLGRYKISKVQPFDLFPQTRHLECVITLERC